MTVAAKPHKCRGARCRCKLTLVQLIGGESVVAAMKVAGRHGLSFAQIGQACTPSVDHLAVIYTLVQCLLSERVVELIPGSGCYYCGRWRLTEAAS